jgi:hypothetical protein
MSIKNFVNIVEGEQSRSKIIVKSLRHFFTMPAAIKLVSMHVMPSKEMEHEIKRIHSHDRSVDVPNSSR